MPCCLPLEQTKRLFLQEVGNFSDYKMDSSSFLTLSSAYKMYTSLFCLQEIPNDLASPIDHQHGVPGTLMASPHTLQPQGKDEAPGKNPQSKRAHS